MINLKTLSVEKFYRLLPNEKSALTSLAVNDSFCVTGWNDGYLRLWPLDFDSPFMEAGQLEHSLNFHLIIVRGI